LYVSRSASAIQVLSIKRARETDEDWLRLFISTYGRCCGRDTGSAPIPDIVISPVSTPSRSLTDA